MKILYHHRIASKDGQNVHVEEIIHALRQLGHEVRVVSPGVHDDSDFGHEGGWVSRLKAALPKAVYELMEMAYSFHAYRKLAAAIREFQPDAIYERYNLFLFSGIWASRRYKLPMLLEVNAPIAEERARYDGMAFKNLARRAQAYVWQRAGLCLPVTQVLAGYVERAGVPRARIEVIHNGINEAHFGALPDTTAAKAKLGLGHRTVLGFTGFVRSWHGLDKIIRWMATKGREDVHLLVVGEGPARAELEALSRELGLADRVTFTGLVPRDQVPDHVAAFDVALQPAVVEYASPLKLFEYLALGRAIVAPRVPNLMEILTEDENALLFDPDIPDDLERALGRLCDDPALRQRLGQGARDTIQARGYTWRGNAERIVDLFQRLSAPSRHG
ncbi:MAG: glycosyltransferase family 4 protein [Pseudomonadota bacterium]